jgi:hypothetical protein
MKCIAGRTSDRGVAGCRSQRFMMECRRLLFGNLPFFDDIFKYFVFYVNFSGKIDYDHNY